MTIRISRISLLVFILFSGLLLNLAAQNDTLQIPEQFLFPEFSPGVVKMKNGERVVLNLNYNIVTEKMVFLQKGRVYDMVSYDLIDTVYINGRRFIPEKKVFYEVLVNAPVSLFIQHAGSVISPAKPAAYGGTTQVSSSTYINNISLGNDVFRMKGAAEIVIVARPVLWIRKNNEMFLISGKKDLLKVFSDRKAEVKEFMNKNKTDVEDPDHLRSLVNYYNGLSR